MAVSPHSTVRRKLRSDISTSALALALAALVIGVATRPAVAQTWVGGSSDWNAAANWNPATVPASGATATFAGVGATNITLSATTTPGNIVFNAGAQAYTINSSSSADGMAIISAGITNNSSQVQTFSSTAGGTFQFQGSASAGTNTLLTASNGGFLQFFDTSSAASAMVQLGTGGYLAQETTGNLNLGALSGVAGSTVLLTSFATGTPSLTVGALNTNTTFAGVISEQALPGAVTGSLVKVGTGSLTLTGANTYTGGTTIAAGTLQLGNGGSAGSITGTITDNAALTFDRSDSVTFAGVISGSGSVGQLGSGTLVFTAVNTYAGGTTISSGTLALSGSGSLGSGTINFDGGTLRALTTTALNNPVQFDSNAGTIAAASGQTLTLTGNLTFNTSASNGHTVYIGSATDTGTINVSSSTVTLGANPGPLEIMGGTLKDTSATAPQSNFATALGNLSSVTIDSGATLEIDSNGNGRGSSTETFIKLSGAGQLVVGGGYLPRVVLGNSNFSGQITAAGTGYIGIGPLDPSKPHATVVLTGNNNSAVEFQIGTGSTLQIGNGGAIGSLSSSSHVVGYSNSNGNAVLEYDRSDNVTLGSFLIGSLVLQQAGSGILTVSANNTNGAPSSFYGSVVVSSGGLSIFSDNNLNGNPVTLSNGTTLYVTAGNTYTSPVTVAGNATFNVSNGMTAAWSGQIMNGAGSSGIQVAGGGTLTLTNTLNSYSGGTTVSVGTVAIANNSALGAASGVVTLNGGTLEFISALTMPASRSYTIGAAGGTFRADASSTIAGVISGPGNVTYSGSGGLTLTGNNTYAGGTTITAGTLQLGNGGSAGSITGNIADNAALIFDRSDNITVSSVISGTGSLTQAGPGTVTLAASNSYAGGTTVSNGTLAIASDTNLGATTGVVTLNGGALEFTSALTMPASRSYTIGAAGGTFRADASSTIAGVISGPGNVTYTGSGGLTLTANNTYAGGTTVSNGTLAIASDTNLGATTGVVALNGGTLEFISALTMPASRSYLIGAAGGTFRADASSTIAGVISGPGNVTYTGSGGLTLTGNNTYVGGTTIAVGTLNVTGSIAGSSVNVASGATLAGTGKTGSVTVASGGVLSPGANPGTGTLTIQGNLSLASGATTVDYLNPSASSAINVTGTAAINGSLVANASPGVYLVGQRYTLASAAGGLSGTYASFSTTGLPFFVKGRLGYDANDVYLYLDANALSPLLDAGATVDERNVAGGIDAAIKGGTNLTGGFLTLANLSGSALDGALDQLSGQIANGGFEAANQSFIPYLALLTDMSGQNTGGPAMPFTPQASYDMPGAPHPAQAHGEVRFWGTVFGGQSNLSGDAVTGAHGLSSGHVGVAGGIETQLDDVTLVGASLAGGHESFSSGDGHGGSDDFMLAAYGRHTIFGQGYVSAALAYGWYDISTRRVVTVSGTDLLTANFTGHDLGGRIDAGYGVVLDDASTLIPYAAYAGQEFRTPGYGEKAASGSSTFALSYAPKTTDAGHIELGSHYDRNFATPDGAVISLDATGAWEHELNDNPLALAAFQALPGSGFVVYGARAATDSALLGLGLHMKQDDGLSFGFHGDARVGAGTTILTGTAEFSLNW